MPRYENTIPNSPIKAIVTYPNSNSPHIYIQYNSTTQEILKGGTLVAFIEKQKKENMIDINIYNFVKSEFALLFKQAPLPEEKDFSLNAYEEHPQISYSNGNVSNTYKGVTSGFQQLPFLNFGIKVLDVGAGDGVNAERMRNIYKCEVYAIEPEAYSLADGIFALCRHRLGEEKVEKLTLQEAVAKKPHKYVAAFDVVTVFKYCIPLYEKESFIMALAQTIKPDGTVHITSVESQRLFKKSGPDEVFYLIDTLKKYFDDIQILDRAPTDGVIVCRKPIVQKLSLAAAVSATNGQADQDIKNQTVAKALENARKFGSPLYVAPKPTLAALATTKGVTAGKKDDKTENSKPSSWWCCCLP